jgi:uncharacterized protein
MPIAPRISAVALRTTDLARSTAFSAALGWKLSPASTAAMSLFKTAGGVVVRRAAPTALGGSYGFFADPDGHLWEVIHHPLYQLGTDGRPEIP